MALFRQCLPLGYTRRMEHEPLEYKIVMDEQRMRPLLPQG
jgi:hypothetical protein